MKRCQKCSRTFPDENQKFCTFDGGLLMADQPAFDPNRTILAPQMQSLPPVPRPPAPTPQPTPPVQSPPVQSPPVQSAPPPEPKPPERDLSETIVAYRPDPNPQTTSSGSESLTAPTGGQTSQDLTLPPALVKDATTSSDLVMPPGATEVLTSTDLTETYSGAPTSRELPPPPVTAPPPPPVPYAAAPTSRELPPLPGGPPPPPTPPPTPAQQAPTTVLSEPGPQPPAPVKKKRSVLPWIIAILVLLLLGLAGIGVAGYIFRAQIREFLKPYMESKNQPTPTPANENSNANSSANANTNSNSANANTSANANSEAKKEPPAYVPSADAVQFTNSKDNLDGDLAEHYVGFSFYFPKTWTKDPKAGVHGATSFAKVDRQFSDSTGEFIQERAVVTWYPSKGSYESDQSIFPEQATKFTKGLQDSGYEEVSHGETTVNAYKAYEVRFKGEFKSATKNLPYWGRVIFLPPQGQNEKTGIAIVMLATSYAPGVASAEDVGSKDELRMILDSFRFAPKP